MTPPLSTRLVAAVLLAAIVTSLGSCGRKGGLEPEPGSTVSAPPSEGEPAEGQGPKREKPKPRPFPLDPML